MTVDPDDRERGPVTTGARAAARPGRRRLDAGPHAHRPRRTARAGRRSPGSVRPPARSAAGRRPRRPSIATSPCSSTSDASTAASAITGSGTAPPAIPECTGPSSARSSMSAAARPRSEYVRPGTPTFQLPASASTSTSAAQLVERVRSGTGAASANRSPPRPRRAPHVARQRAVRLQPRGDRGRVRDRARLVVGTAAPVEPAVALDGRERIAAPALDDAGRLHVVVRIEQHGRRAGPACIHSPMTYGCEPSTPASRTCSNPLRSSSAAVASALACTSATCSGSALMLGMRTSASSSARAAGIAASTRRGQVRGQPSAACRTGPSGLERT